jgi:hypothetical protein
MKLRRTLISAALAVAATVGMTVPLAAPASAASCTEVQSLSGSSSAIYRSSEVDVTPYVNVGVANCAGWHYRYTVYIFEDQTIYGSSSATGTTQFGSAYPATIRTSGVPNGHTQLVIGYRTQVYDLTNGTWNTVNRGAWRLQTPGSFNTSTGQNTSYYAYAGPGGCGVYGYQPPCLPFF